MIPLFVGCQEETSPDANRKPVYACSHATCGYRDFPLGGVGPTFQPPSGMAPGLKQGSFHAFHLPKLLGDSPPKAEQPPAT